MVTNDLSSFSLKPQQVVQSARRMFPVEQVVEGPPWEAVWPFMCDPEILQRRVTARKWNDAGRFGPYCEFFFFMVTHELGNVLHGEAPTRDWLLLGRLLR